MKSPTPDRAKEPRYRSPARPRGARFKGAELVRSARLFRSQPVQLLGDTEADDASLRSPGRRRQRIGVTGLCRRDEAETQWRRTPIERHWQVRLALRHQPLSVAVDDFEHVAWALHRRALRPAIKADPFVHRSIPLRRLVSPTKFALLRSTLGSELRIR
jgi:hypothetical protein